MKDINSNTRNKTLNALRLLYHIYLHPKTTIDNAASSLCLSRTTIKRYMKTLKNYGVEVDFISGKSEYRIKSWGLINKDYFLNIKFNAD